MSDTTDPTYGTGVSAGWPPPSLLLPTPAPPADPEPEPAAGTAEHDAVLGTPVLLTLASGTRVRLRPLKSRELFALVGIAISGIGTNLGEVFRLDPDAPTQVFMARFVGLLISALPDEADRTFAFLRMVVQPEQLVVDGRIDKAVKARNDALNAALDAELSNPDPLDTITIIEAIAANNAGDLQAWGKRLAGIWKVAQRTGQIPASPQSQG